MWLKKPVSKSKLLLTRLFFQGLFNFKIQWTRHHKHACLLLVITPSILHEVKSVTHFGSSRPLLHPQRTPSSSLTIGLFYCFMGNSEIITKLGEHFEVLKCQFLVSSSKVKQSCAGSMIKRLQFFLVCNPAQHMAVRSLYSLPQLD